MSSWRFRSLQAPSPMSTAASRSLLARLSKVPTSLALAMALVALPLATPTPAAAIGLAELAGSVFPACSLVELQATVSEGRPPFQYVWTLPSGHQLSGETTFLDTSLLPGGPNTLSLQVLNDAGSDTLLFDVEVESLAFASLPSWSLPSASSNAVSFRANTTGATEWRWTWGDGTTSGWQNGCGGSDPTHVYPTRGGLYTVQLEARSCVAGLTIPLVSLPILVDLPTLPAIFSDSFESGDESGWTFVQK